MLDRTDGSWPYALYIPLGRSPWRGAPLLVVLHGCTQDPRDIAVGTRMNALADRHRAVVAYPQQLPSRNRRSCWHWYERAHQHRDGGEPSAIADITRTVVHGGSPWRIDGRRVYAVGMSAGAAMTAVLGVTYPDLYAALGMHSGVPYGAAVTVRQALGVMRRGVPGGVAAHTQRAVAAMGPRARVVPTVVVHGALDRRVRAVNGEQVTDQWIRVNRSVAPQRYPADLRRPDAWWESDDDRHRVEVRRWCDRDGVVVQEHHHVAGLGHAWSGGDARGTHTAPGSPDASATMWRFLSRHAH